MTVRLNPYFQFRGQAREALAFYGGVFGAEPTIMTFADMGGMGMPEDQQQLVMHGQLDVAPGDAGAVEVHLMAADVPAHMEGDFPNGTQSLSGDDEATLRGWFEALTDGGTVTYPLEKAPWGDHFGQGVDRYGVTWLVNIAGGDAPA